MSILRMRKIGKGYKQMTPIIREVLLRPPCELSRAECRTRRPRLISRDVRQRAPEAVSLSVIMDVPFNIDERDQHFSRIENPAAAALAGDCVSTLHMLYSLHKGLGLLAVV